MSSNTIRDEFSLEFNAFFENIIECIKKSDLFVKNEKDGGEFKGLIDDINQVIISEKIRRKDHEVFNCRDANLECYQLRHTKLEMA